MAINKHMTRAQLVWNINNSRAAITSQNKANVDATPDGGTLAYFALDDILLIGNGHDAATSWIGMCEEANDALIGGKIRVTKDHGIDRGTLTVTTTAGKEQQKAIAKAIQQFSRKHIDFVHPGSVKW
jgi:hypothetical protein